MSDLLLKLYLVSYTVGFLEEQIIIVSLLPFDDNLGLFGRVLPLLATISTSYLDHGLEFHQVTFDICVKLQNSLDFFWKFVLAVVRLNWLANSFTIHSPFLCDVRRVLHYLLLAFLH